MASKLLVALLIGSFLLSASARGADWVQFRGPNNSGIAADSQTPAEWSGYKNLAWKQAIPGYSWSSPIVVGDKLIVTTAVSEKQARPKAMNFGDGGFAGRGGFGFPGGFTPFCTARPVGVSIAARDVAAGRDGF